MKKPEYTIEVTRCISMRGMNLKLSRMVHPQSYSVFIYPCIELVPTWREPILIHLN